MQGRCVCVCGSVRLGAPAGSGSPYGVGGPCRVSGPWRILLALGATKGDLLPAALKGSRFRAAAAGQGPFPTDALEVSGRTMGGTQPRTTARVPVFSLSVLHASLGTIKRAGGCPTSTTSTTSSWRFQLRTASLQGQRAEEDCSLPWHRPHLPPTGLSRPLDVWDCSDRADAA